MRARPRTHKSGSSVAAHSTSAGPQGWRESGRCRTTETILEPQPDTSVGSALGLPYFLRHVEHEVLNAPGGDVFRSSVMLAVLLCLATTLAEAAGVQFFEISAEGVAPKLTGAVW